MLRVEARKRDARIVPLRREHLARRLLGLVHEAHFLQTVVRRRRRRVRVGRIWDSLLSAGGGGASARPQVSGRGSSNVPQRRLGRCSSVDGLLALDEVVRRDRDVGGAQLGEEDLGQEGSTGRLLLDGCGRKVLESAWVQPPRSGTDGRAPLRRTKPS